MSMSPEFINLFYLFVCFLIYDYNLIMYYMY